MKKLFSVIWAIVIIVFGLMLIVWIGYNLFIEMQPEAKGRNPIVPLMFGISAFLLGVKKFRDVFSTPSNIKTISMGESIEQQIIRSDVVQTCDFKPGDKVVSLASATRSAAIVAGVVCGAIAAWIVKYEFIFSGIVGAIVGWILGTLVGRIMFPALDGKTVIVKAGPSSLMMILKSNIIASLITGITVCQLISFLTKTDFTEIALASVSSSLVVGVIFAFLASLM